MSYQTCLGGLRPHRVVLWPSSRTRADISSCANEPSGVVNAHLWEFPNVEIGPNGFDAKRLALTVLGMNPKAAAPFCVIKHSITRYRITLEAFRVSGTIPRRNGSPQSRWVHDSQMNRLPFASAHRKILERLRT